MESFYPTPRWNAGMPWDQGLWKCKKCKGVQPAVIEKRKIKTRRFATGYVAVFLACGHTTAIAKDKVKLC